MTEIHRISDFNTNKPLGTITLIVKTKISCSDDLHSFTVENTSMISLFRLT